MHRRAPAWGFAFVAILMTPPEATPAGPGLPTGTTAPVVVQATTATPAAQRKRRRARRPPPGGVYSRQAIVVDPYTDEVLFEKNASRRVPIASLTKLMTALVFVELQPDLDRVAEITREELLGGGLTQLLRREQVRLEDLLHMSLMCSDNVATRVLVRESGLGSEEFLTRMNRRSLELGLTDSRFVEFTGLDAGNVSTASDIARLLRAASDNYTIREISTKLSHEFRTNLRPHHIPNTNRLLRNQRVEIMGGKTGFISASGYCFATWIRKEGRDLIAVVLGAPTKASRFSDVLRLVERTARSQPRSES